MSSFGFYFCSAGVRTAVCWTVSPLGGAGHTASEARCCGERSGKGGRERRERRGEMRLPVGLGVFSGEANSDNMWPWDNMSIPDLVCVEESWTDFNKLVLSAELPVHTRHPVFTKSVSKKLL